METSLSETIRIEQFIDGSLEPGDGLIVQAKMITDHSFASKVQAQQQTHHVVKLYGRKKLRARLNDIHIHLFTDPQKLSFKEKILRIFH